MSALDRAGGRPSSMEQTELERFWMKVDKSGGSDACWPWTAGRGRGGYGKFKSDSVKGGFAKAHRYSYALFYRVSIKDLQGKVIRHTCDNPPCCNPTHLLSGSAQDNTNDSIERGRHAFGEHHGRTKLTEEIVADIRRIAAEGILNQRELAYLSGITHQQISHIVSRKQWKHI